MSGKQQQQTLSSWLGSSDSSNHANTSSNSSKRPIGQKASKVTYEETKRKRAYVKSWEAKFAGLQDSENGMICTICIKYAGQGDSKFLKGTESYRIDTLKAHWSSPKHIQCCRAQACEEQGGQCPLDLILVKLGERNKQILTYMFNTAYFVLKMEMPFTAFPSLVKLQAKKGSELNRLLSYNNDRACGRLLKYFVEDIREPIQNDLRDAKVLSIFFYGATDNSVSEVEIVYCRYLKDGQPRDVFLGLEDLEHAHADGVFDAVARVMERLVGEDWHDKVVGAGCDGASVNLGKRNSVATRLCDGHEYIIPVHCVAHRLELAVLDSLKDEPALSTVQDILKKMYKHYHYSPKALRELRAIAEHMEERIIKPTRLQVTRWVPHFEKASRALITGYRVLVTHFQHVGEAGHGQATAEVRGRARFIAQKLTDFRVLRFVFFVQDVLKIKSTLSLRFQKDGSTCVDALDALDTACLELTELSQVLGENYQVFLEDIDQENCSYQGINLTHYDGDRAYADMSAKCEVVRACISARLDNHRDTSMQVLKPARVFDTREWPVQRAELPHFGNAQVQVLADHFHPLLERLDVDEANIQRAWTEVKANVGHRLFQRPRPNPRPSVETLLLTPARFPNFLTLAEIIFCLPTSSAICERGFSCVKRIKSDWRSSLATAQLDKLFLISIEGPSVHGFTPHSNNLKNYFNDS